MNQYLRPYVRQDKIEAVEEDYKKKIEDTDSSCHLGCTVEVEFLKEDGYQD
jgi:hypothetical protein